MKIKTGGAKLIVLPIIGMVFAGVAVLAPVEAQAAGYSWCNQYVQTRDSHGWAMNVPAYNGSRYCVVYEGVTTTANTVMAVQSALDYCNNTPVTVDGVWGPKTTTALQSFQTGRVTADGQYGPQTHNVMWFSDTLKVTVATGYDCAWDSAL